MKQILYKLLTDKAFIEIYYKNEIQDVSYSMLQKFFEYASFDEIENCGAYINGQYIIAWLSVASGQGGIVLVWDVEQKEIVHLSEGAYVQKALLFNDKLYVLREVGCWGIKNYLSLGCCPFGIMDVWDSSIYEDIPINIELDDDRVYDNNNYILKILDDNKLIAGYKSVIYEVKLNHN